MDATLLRAGRTTHLKIVLVALVAAAAVVAVGVNNRTEDFATAGGPIDAPAVIKAGQPAVFAGELKTSIR